MINEDKIKLMTSIAMFEKKEGKRVFPVNTYFKGDYLSRHLVRSFLGYTFCWMLGMVVWMLYNVETLLGAVVLENFKDMLIRFGVLYGVGLLVYLVITLVVYGRRYAYAGRGMKIYISRLKRLERRYEFQSKSREATKEGNIRR